MSDFVFAICKWIIIIVVGVLVVSAGHGWTTGGDPYAIAYDVFDWVKSFFSSK